MHETTNGRTVLRYRTRLIGDNDATFASVHGAVVVGICHETPPPALAVLIAAMAKRPDIIMHGVILLDRGPHGTGHGFARAVYECARTTNEQRQI